MLYNHYAVKTADKNAGIAGVSHEFMGFAVTFDVSNKIYKNTKKWEKKTGRTNSFDILNTCRSTFRVDPPY